MKEYQYGEFLTREDWLKEAVLLIESDILSTEGVSLPEYWDIGVGFAHGSKTAIGQAWDKDVSEDKKVHHMFISPTLGSHDIVNLLQVVLHEMIHISVGIDQKHGGDFKRVARDVGLEGRLTATYVTNGSPLFNKLADIAAKIGKPYPHTAITIMAKPKQERVSNFTKIVSTQDSEYVLRIKKDVLADSGFPKDPWGFEMVELEG